MDILSLPNILLFSASSLFGLYPPGISGRLAGKNHGRSGKTIR